jgi:polyisoprenoid-binding protein YceI
LNCEAPAPRPRHGVVRNERGVEAVRNSALLVLLAAPLFATLTAAGDRHGAPHVIAPVRYVVAPDGNEARYRVREQLLNHDLPNDAVGTTSAVTGAVTVSPGGTIDTAASRITIDVRSLKSDQNRRDGYVQRRLLQTDQYPTVTFVPTALIGAIVPLASGQQTFDVDGLITVHGVTRHTVWHVKTQSAGPDVTGTSFTQFTFKDISLDQPHVPVVLSVADTIRLEYDFHLVRQP